MKKTEGVSVRIFLKPAVDNCSVNCENMSPGNISGFESRRS